MSPRKPRPPKQRPPDPDTVDAPWRVFLAVALPEEAREAVAGEVGRLKPLDWPVRWVDADNAHLTLHFLGEQPRERVELLRLGLPAVVAAHEAFALRTGNLGAFPNVRRPRVLWLGLFGPTHRMEALHADLGASLRDLGFDAPEEPFHPHVTLGRVRNEGTKTVALRDLPDVMRRTLADPATGVMAGPPAAPVPVAAVELVRSHLGREGARYETVSRFPLAGALAEPEAGPEDAP